MELTSKEIAALKSIDVERLGLKTMAWSLLFWGAVMFANDGAGWVPRSQVPLSAVFLLGGFFILTATYFRTSSNQRLLEVLKRYVNSDADALMQITEDANTQRAT